jgi:hypothetical protein
MVSELVHDSRVSSRIMYGSDWFMDTMSDDDAGYYDQLDRTMAQLAADLPTFMPDFRRNNALGFLGLRNPANQNYQRLSAFYTAGGQPFPDWLPKPPS